MLNDNALFSTSHYLFFTFYVSHILMVTLYLFILFIYKFYYYVTTNVIVSYQRPILRNYTCLFIYVSSYFYT